MEKHFIYLFYLWSLHTHFDVENAWAHQTIEIETIENEVFNFSAENEISVRIKFHRKLLHINMYICVVHFPQKNVIISKEEHFHCSALNFFCCFQFLRWKHFL